MFAGRYLWWTLISIATFLFFAVYFDYIGWVVVQSSGCSDNAGTCEPLQNFLLRDIKPIGFWLAGGLVFTSMIARIHYLRMSWLWSLAVAVWFLSAEPFPMLFIDLWEGRLRLEDIFDAIPLSLLLLSAFGAFLLIPFDEQDRAPFGGWLLPRLVAALATVYSVLLAIATEPRLVPLVAKSFRRPDIAASIGDWQSLLASVVHFGGDAGLAAELAYWGFVLALIAGALPPRHVEALLDRTFRTARTTPRRRRPRKLKAFVKQLSEQRQPKLSS